MKNVKGIILVLVFSCFSISSALGQDQLPNFPLDKATGKILYSEVVSVDSTISKQELYAKAREWFAKVYKSSTDVIQMDDKESGKIVGKALIAVYMKSIFGQTFPGGYMNYTISVFVKDGRYKYDISNFYHTGTWVQNSKIPDGGDCENLIAQEKGFWGNSFKKTYLLTLIQMDDNINSLISSLKADMNKKKLSQQENW